MVRKATWRAALQWLMLALLSGTLAPAQEAAPSLNQVEAAFIYHFAEFVTWPREALPATNSPILFGLLGQDPVGADLEAAIRNKEIKGHPLRFEHFDVQSVAQARRCHLLFIDPEEKKHLKEILAQLQGASVLTVSSKLNQFTELGGMINFYVDYQKGAKVRFEINDQAARQAGLKISAKLLSLARRKETP